MLRVLFHSVEYGTAEVQQEEQMMMRQRSRERMRESALRRVRNTLFHVKKGLSRLAPFLLLITQPTKTTQYRLATAPRPPPRRHAASPISIAIAHTIEYRSGFVSRRSSRRSRPRIHIIVVIVEESDRRVSVPVPTSCRVVVKGAAHHRRGGRVVAAIVAILAMVGETLPARLDRRETRLL